MFIRDIPILVHTKLDNWAHPQYVIEFAERHPDIRICAAHCAHFNPDFYDAIKKKHLVNLFVDSSPFNRICFDMCKSNQEKIGFDFFNPDKAYEKLFSEIPTHLLWGTDAPFNRFLNNDCCLNDYGDDVEIVQEYMRPQLANNVSRFLFGE